MPGTLLLIVDVQQGFINVGTAHIPARVSVLQTRDTYQHVIATRFVNPEDSAHRRFIHWDRFAPGSVETQLAFRPARKTEILDKTMYTCVNDAFLTRLWELGIDEVHLCGIATDNCILKCAADLFEANIRPVVIAQACGSHGGKDYHEWGLNILRRMIGDDQVIDGPVAHGS